MGAPNPRLGVICRSVRREHPTLTELERKSGNRRIEFHKHPAHLLVPEQLPSEVPRPFEDYRKTQSANFFKACDLSIQVIRTRQLYSPFDLLVFRLTCYFGPQAGHRYATAILQRYHPCTSSAYVFIGFIL